MSGTNSISVAVSADVFDPALWTVLALGLRLVAGFGVVALVVWSLKGAAGDVNALAELLPSRYIKEDGADARERNRQNTLRDLRKLMLWRLAPGVLVTFAGLALLTLVFRT